MRNLGVVGVMVLSAMLFALAMFGTGCATLENGIRKSQDFGMCVPPVVAAATCLIEAAKKASPNQSVP